MLVGLDIRDSGDGTQANVGLKKDWKANVVMKLLLIADGMSMNSELDM